MFITSNARIEQTYKRGYCKLIDNEVYVCNNGKIILAPRYLWTNNYTFLLSSVPFLQGKSSFDVRPSHLYDLMYRFHEVITVNLTIKQLIDMNIIHEYKDKIVCEDIPEKYLTIEKIPKTDCDNLLQEMMLSCKVKERTVKIIRFRMRFNLNWYFRTGKKTLAEYKLFHEDIALVNNL